MVVASFGRWLHQGCTVCQDWRPGMRRTDTGKPKRVARDEGEDDKRRMPFDRAAPTPSQPSDGSFSGAASCLELEDTVNATLQHHKQQPAHQRVCP